MNLTSLIFLVLLSLIGITYFYIGLTKKDYVLLICGVFIGVYSFFVKDIVWISLLGLVFILSPFALSGVVRKFLTEQNKEQIMDPVLLRRSIRNYTNQNVSAEIIEYLLEAAMSAPSAGNEFPWHFIVVNSRSMIDKLSSVHPHAQMLKDAPLAIVVACDMNLDLHKGYWIQDCSAATENMLIAARSKGLGSVWLGVYPREQRMENIKKLFWMPDNVVPFSVVALGYPAEEKPYEKRYNSTRVHYNGW